MAGGGKKKDLSMAKNIVRITITILILLLIAIWVEIAKSPSDENMHLYFFDVGQGDAAMIVKGDYQILVDGGPDDSVLSKIGEVMPISDRKIEKVILTHPHADHLVGLVQVLERYEIGEIYISGVAHTSNQYLEFLSKIKEKNIQTTMPEVNQKEMIFDNGSLTFLWPGKKYQEQTVENLNNSSIVSKFCYYSKCAMLMGDIELDGQSEMYSGNKNADFQASVLKVAHHGSNNGTNQVLLDKVKPQYAVISVGADNKYGHPHAAILDLLEKSNIKIFRTDRDGTVELIFEQNNLIVKAP